MMWSSKITPNRKPCEEFKMANYQQCVNRETPGSNYAEYCASLDIHKRKAEIGMFPEHYAPNLYEALEDGHSEYYAPHMHKETPERDTFVDYKAPSNIYQDIEGEILNRHSPLKSVKGTLEISKYAECYANSNLCILTSKGDTFSEYHNPSSIYVGTLEGDKITEYRATQNVYKIIPEALKDSQYPVQIPPVTTFQNLTISECPSSLNNATMMHEKPAAAIGNPIEENNIYPVNLLNPSSEEVDVFTFSALLPWEETQKRIKEAENYKPPTSDNTNPDEEMVENPFLPGMCRRKPEETNEDDCSLMLNQLKDSKSSTPTKEADTTCSTNEDCKCEENFLCRCLKMRGKYYDYYKHMQEKEYYTMYPQGKCTLPKGTVLHFTGASDNMKREVIKDALEVLDAKIEYIDYQKGNKDGWVRLSFPHEARIIIKKMAEKKIKIDDAELIFRVLSGKEEKRYLKKVTEDIYKLQQKGKSLNKMLKKHGYKYVKNIN